MPPIHSVHESLASWVLAAPTARLAAIALVAAATAVQAASDVAPLRAGQPLPPLEGTFLSGRRAALPAASAGKVALVMMGFTYQSRFPVEAWGGWFRKLTAGNPQATSFEVPMIGGLARLGKWFIDSGMRKGTPADLQENVITVYSGSGDWRKRLGVSSANEDDAFLLLLDRQGVVRWMHHGPFDQASARQLTGVMESLGVEAAAAAAPNR